MIAPSSPSGRARPARRRPARRRPRAHHAPWAAALAFLLSAAPLACGPATVPAAVASGGAARAESTPVDAPSADLAAAGVAVDPGGVAPGATPVTTATGAWLFPGVDDVAEPNPELVAALHAAANEARSAHGAQPTAWDEGLARAARQHAAELAARNVLDHLGLDPTRRTVADRLARAGSPYTTHAENLAAVPPGLDAVRATVDGWLQSPGHRANLLQPGFDRMGFGTAEGAGGTVFVTQVLARAPWVPLDGATSLIALDALRLTLELWVAAPTTVLVEVEGTQSRHAFAAGAHTWATDVASAGPWDVLVAVPAATAGRFTIEDAGRVASDGRWLPDEGRVRPRELVRVASAALEPYARDVVRLRLVLPTPEAGLVVDGSQVPGANRGGGLIEADLELDDGGELLLGLAEPAGDGAWAVRHRWALRRDGLAIDWEARP